MSTPKIIVIISLVMIAGVFAWIGWELFVRPPMETPKTDFIHKESPLNKSPVTSANESPIEINQIRVLRDIEGDRKITHSVSFSATSKLRTGASLDFILAAVAERLSGSTNIKVAKESSEIKDSKFTGKISPELVLPPGRYYLVVRPSAIQKDKSISFSKDDQVSMSASKYVVIGTIAERLEFMRKEYESALGYTEELNVIYQTLQEIINKSQQDKKPPANDISFQKWLKDSLTRVKGIDNEIAVQLRNQDYLTFYAQTFSTLHELPPLLESQLQQLNRAVIIANKNKETSFSFAIHSRMSRLIADIRAFLTKETILNLDWFYYAMTEDTVVIYETIKDSPNALKDWQAQEAVCDEYFMKSDEFISGFKPLVDNIWKNNIGKVSESQMVVKEIKESYLKKINGDKSDTLTRRLKELKKNLGEILYDLRLELNK